jgi:hypothetical protein
MAQWSGKLEHCQQLEQRRSNFNFERLNRQRELSSFVGHDQLQRGAVSKSDDRQRRQREHGGQHDIHSLRPQHQQLGKHYAQLAGFGTYFNFGGAVTLNGGGTLTMGNNSANYLFGYAQPGPGASLTNKSTIQGAGHIGWNGGIGTGNSFANQGTINANQSASAFPAYRQSPKQEFTGTGAATSASDSFVGLGMVDGTSDINRA